MALIAVEAPLREEARRDMMRDNDEMRDTPRHRYTPDAHRPPHCPEDIVTRSFHRHATETPPRQRMPVVRDGERGVITQERRTTCYGRRGAEARQALPASRRRRLPFVLRHRRPCHAAAFENKKIVERRCLRIAVLPRPSVTASSTTYERDMREMKPTTTSAIKNRHNNAG